MSDLKFFGWKAYYITDSIHVLDNLDVNSERDFY